MARAPPRAAASRQAGGTCSVTQARVAAAASSADDSGMMSTRSAIACVSVIGSTSPELRAALVLEGGQPFPEVLAAGRQLQGQCLVVELLVEGLALAGPQQPLGEAQGH